MKFFFLAAVLATVCLASTAARAADPGALPAAAAETQPVRFTLRIDAPRPYRDMLEKGLEIARWRGNDQITLPLLQRLVDEARQETVDTLAAEGYFAPDVRSGIDKGEKGDAVVRITVDPGPRTVIGNVDVAVGGAVLEDPKSKQRVAAVSDTWRLPQGEPFTQTKWEDAKDTALAHVARPPYAAARILESEARVDPQSGRADLKLRLDSGPVFHAGGLEVRGMKRYPASVVENVYPFERGEPFDALKLDLFQRRLLESRYFSAVRVGIDPDPAKTDAATLHVSVVEAPSQRIDTGIAFNTDTGPGLTLDYGDADVRNSAWRFRSVLNLNTKEQKLDLTFDSPPRPGGTWNTWSGRVARTDIEGQLTQEVVLGFAHNWGLESTPSSLLTSMHFERKDIEGSRGEDIYTLYTGYRRTFRRTEDLINPRRGVLGSVEVGAGIPGISTREFARVDARATWLIPLGLRNDFTLRGEFGAVIARDRTGIPSSFLFRTGGDLTVRGYGYQTIGVPEGEATVGGRYLAIASAEYTRWITETIGAATFVDAGDAFDEPRAFDLAVGYGIGVRWRSPIGPFRADVAYGERTGSFRLHFSAGYTF